MGNRGFQETREHFTNAGFLAINIQVYSLLGVEVR